MQAFGTECLWRTSVHRLPFELKKFLVCSSYWRIIRLSVPCLVHTQAVCQHMLQASKRMYYYVHCTCNYDANCKQKENFRTHTQCVMFGSQTLKKKLVTWTVMFGSQKFVVISALPPPLMPNVRHVGRVWLGWNLQPHQSF